MWFVQLVRENHISLKLNLVKVYFLIKPRFSYVQNLDVFSWVRCVKHDRQIVRISLLRNTNVDHDLAGNLVVKLNGNSEFVENGGFLCLHPTLTNKSFELESFLLWLLVVLLSNLVLKLVPHYITNIACSLDNYDLLVILSLRARIIIATFWNPH
jgi:hypothetical protein